MLNPHVPVETPSPRVGIKAQETPPRSILHPLNAETQQGIFKLVFSFLGSSRGTLSIQPRRDGRLGCLYVQQPGFPRIRMRSDCWRISYSTPKVASYIATFLLLIPGQAASVQALSYKFVRQLQHEFGEKYICYVAPPSAKVHVKHR